MAKERLETEEESSTGIPFLNAYGNVTKALERIVTASTPQRFTHDFLQTKLNLKGGSARPIIPFLKRTGFINSDGSPTDLYKKFRNSASRAESAAKAVRKGYAPLYEINEYVHDVKDDELKGIIVQATGLNSTSSAVKGMMGSFKALKAFANFDNQADNFEEDLQEEEPLKENAGSDAKPKGSSKSVDLKLGYTINLNLPPTSDVAVFDAIFKSLRKHLLDE
jgi:hypothetical protein